MEILILCGKKGVQYMLCSKRASVVCVLHTVQQDEVLEEEGRLEDETEEDKTKDVSAQHDLHILIDTLVPPHTCTCIDAVCEYTHHEQENTDSMAPTQKYIL